MIANLLPDHDDLIIKRIIIPLLPAQQLKPLNLLAPLVLLKISIDQQLVMHLVDDDLLAVNDEYELIGIFILLEDIIQDGFVVVLVLESQVALILVVGVVAEAGAPGVAVCVGFYLDGGDVLAGEDGVGALG